jgi:hypothetical protein
MNHQSQVIFAVGASPSGTSRQIRWIARTSPMVQGRGAATPCPTLWNEGIRFARAWASLAKGGSRTQSPTGLASSSRLRPDTPGSKLT